MPTVQQYGVEVDPFQAENRRGESAHELRYILIQSSERWREEHRRELASLGLECRERVEREVYLCAGREVDLQEVRALWFVEDAADYAHRYKLSEELAEPRMGLLGAVEREVRIDLALQGDIAPQAFVAKLNSGAWRTANVELGRSKVRCTVNVEDLKSLALVDGVRRIEPVPQYEYCANIACGVIGASEVHSAAQLRGEGEVIGICDSGLDQGKIGDVHPAFAGRVAKLIPLGRSSKTNDPTGHGTHVAGLAVGDSQSNEAAGSITGAAPGAELVVQSVYHRSDPLLGIPTDLHDLFSDVYTDHKVRIHSNSWVERKRGGFYSFHSREIDDFVHRNRDLVVVCAAGNEGRPDSTTGTLQDRTIRPPGTAKNCISVGASENLRPAKDQAWKDQDVFPGRFDQDPMISLDGWADDASEVAPFSGRGPTDHGRIKPDLVAPGTVVLGPRSRSLGSPGAHWGTSIDDQYFYLGGTSMATPLVAGCAAVTRQFLRRELGGSPSAALVKAVLINSADDLSGAPNFSEGWGRVNLARAVHTEAPERVRYFDEGPSLSTGEVATFDLQCFEAGLPLKVTLVWTDPPGEFLQSDLDLVVERAPDDVRNGNQVPGSREFDRTNNVEQVTWEDFPRGLFRVRVRAFVTTLTPRQSFALVIRGGI